MRQIKFLLLSRFVFISSLLLKAQNVVDFYFSKSPMSIGVYYYPEVLCVSKEGITQQHGTRLQTNQTGVLEWKE